jgi:hypothetical protein
VEAVHGVPVEGLSGPDLSAIFEGV